MLRQAAANLLTNDALDPQAKIPEFKACAVQVFPAREDELPNPDIVVQRAGINIPSAFGTSPKSERSIWNNYANEYKPQSRHAVFATPSATSPHEACPYPSPLQRLYVLLYEIFQHLFIIWGMTC